MTSGSPSDGSLRQAILAWGAFIGLAVLMNGTIPFMLGRDLRAWSTSTTKIVLFSLLNYWGMFLMVPLVVTKGWRVVRQPRFWGPSLVAMVGIVLWWPVNRFSASVVVLVLAYLHRRFDLSELGFRSRGVKADAVAVLLMGLLSAIPPLLQGLPQNLAFAPALRATAVRLFGNPASTAENLFYFGFLAELSARQAPRWLTPIAIASMFTLHEMSNPEYWYEGMAFGWVFVGVAVTTVFYSWRRSLVVVWLGDGLSHFIGNLL